MIKVENVSKQFENFTAVDDISFTVPAGSICGFIGPNGAGKTTTMRMLATLDVPDAGMASINGLNVLEKPNEVRAALGYMPDYYGAYPNMTVREYLDFFARSYDLKGDEKQRRLTDVSDFTELTPLLSRPVEGLSKGQKQRLSMARALLPNPSVLILDEPAAGLDPRARVELRELLVLLAEAGKSIFISSHILSELADFIDHLVVIDNGKIQFAGPFAEISGMAEGQHSYLVHVVDDQQVQATHFLLEHRAVKTAELVEGKLRCDFTCEPHELLRDLIEAGFNVDEYGRNRGNLEDIFMKLTDKEA